MGLTQSVLGKNICFYKYAHNLGTRGSPDMILTRFDVKFHEKQNELPPRACSPLKKLQKNNVQRVDPPKVETNYFEIVDPQKVEKKQCATSSLYKRRRTHRRAVVAVVVTAAAPHLHPFPRRRRDHRHGRHHCQHHRGHRHRHHHRHHRTPVCASEFIEA